MASSTMDQSPLAGAGVVASAPRKTTFGGIAVTSVLMVVVLTIIFGFLYPLLMTGLGQLFFNHQANGSLIKAANGQVIGSDIIGQSFTKPQYFHGRASAAGTGYDATSSGGTNLGPTSATLVKNTVKLANAIRKEDDLPSNYPLPADAVSTSASGLDPDISIAYADLQVSRIATARHVSRAAVQSLVDQDSAGRWLGFLGEPRVNVLKINMDLDKKWPLQK